MSRPGITYQEVANAAIQVQSQKENPTVDRVREILGTGSKSTIARYLKEWKLKNGHEVDFDGLPNELFAIVKGLWDRLKSESDHKILQHQQKMDAFLAETRQELTQEQKQNADLQTQIQQLQQYLHQEKHLSTTLLQSLEEEKISNATLMERNERLSHQAESHKSEIERLHQLLAHVQTNLEHYQNAMQKLREEQTLLIDKQKTEFQFEIKSYKKEIVEINTLNKHLQRNSDQVHTELKIIQNELNKVLTEKNNYLQQLQDKILIEATLKNKNENLIQSCFGYQQTAEHNAEYIIELEKKQAVFLHQLEYLQKAFTDSQDTIRILRDEKMFLAKEKADLEGELRYRQTFDNAAQLIENV